MQITNSNSSCVKSSFPKAILYAVFSLPLFLLGQNAVGLGELLEKHHFQLDELANEFQAEPSHYAIIGPSLDLKDTLFPSPQTHQISLFNNQTKAFYLLIEHAAIAVEDGLYVDGQKWDSPPGPKSCLRLDLRSKIELVDHPPYQNSSLICQSLIPAFHEEIAIQEDFGDAEDCQVNPACLGSELSASHRATVRILWVNKGLAGWCTGTLVNNTALDRKPYLLTAEHCALVNGWPNAQDFQQWVFYFQYLSPTCSNPNQEGNLNRKQIVGAEVKARSDDGGGETGSDFLLLELDEKVPNFYEPYYAGWSRQQNASVSGATFHHPSGDIMKYSQYREQPRLGSFSGLSTNSHFLVEWANSAYGHGTTEPGSSGASLLNSTQQVIGVLTGGSSACNNVQGEDYFGTIAYSWDRNGLQANRQLDPWLDPLSKDFLSLGGLDYQDSIISSGAFRWDAVPNPIRSENLILRGSGAFDENIELTLFNPRGQVVRQSLLGPSLTGEIEWPIYRLKSGIYLLSVRQGEDQILLKVLVDQE